MCHANEFITNFRKLLPIFLPKLITEILLYLFSELALNFNWVFERACALIKNLFLKTGCLFGLGT